VSAAGCVAPNGWIILTNPAGRVSWSLEVARTYQHARLSRDLIGGIALVTLLVPQGMAYAELAGLPAITGLYTAV
jgi:MFS superfamily sulfate permease-like transporter